MTYATNINQASTPSFPLLSVQNLTVGYSGLTVIRDLSIDVHEGEVVALIGANGAGKTTTLSVIMGLLRHQAGSISLNGKSVGALPVEQRVARGLSLVQEGRQVVPQLSVLENLQIGAFLRRDSRIDSDLDQIYHRFPRLAERAAQPAGLLSGGEQQMLAMGRALMARPRVLLLDEPSMGLAPLIIAQIFEIIADLNRGGTTILLVEQNANQALRLAHRAYVIEQGRIGLAGTGADVAADPAVVQAYLGGVPTREQLAA